MERGFPRAGMQAERVPDQEDREKRRFTEKMVEILTGITDDYQEQLKRDIEKLKRDIADKESGQGKTEKDYWQDRREWERISRLPSIEKLHTAIEQAEKKMAVNTLAQEVNRTLITESLEELDLPTLQQVYRDIAEYQSAVVRQIMEPHARSYGNQENPYQIQQRMHPAAVNMLTRFESLGMSVIATPRETSGGGRNSSEVGPIVPQHQMILSFQDQNAFGRRNLRFDSQKQMQYPYGGMSRPPQGEGRFVNMAFAGRIVADQIDPHAYSFVGDGISGFQSRMKNILNMEVSNWNRRGEAWSMAASVPEDSIMAYVEPGQAEEEAQKSLNHYLDRFADAAEEIVPDLFVEPLTYEQARGQLDTATALNQQFADNERAVEAGMTQAQAEVAEADARAQSAEKRMQQMATELDGVREELAQEKAAKAALEQKNAKLEYDLAEAGRVAEKNAQEMRRDMLELATQLQSAMKTGFTGSYADAGAVEAVIAKLKKAAE